MSRSYFISSIYAIILHILIILLLFNYIQHEKSSAVGYQQVLQAYVIKHPIIIAKHKLRHRQHHISSLLPKTTIQSHNISQQKSPSPSGEWLGMGPKNSQLLIMLHNQIQQYINDSNNDLFASFGHRAATVQFLLTTQGQVAAVHVIKSSGVRVFDNLALQAVSSIEATSLAKKYLIKDTYFRIKVVY